MPQNHDERLVAWRWRWEKNPRWIDEIVSCLRGEPHERAVRRIVLLPWYNRDNGFRPLSFSPDHPTLILDLRGIPLRHTDLQEISIPFALLDGADFFKCDLQDADLSFCRASQVNFHQANLSGTNLAGARLDFADLSMAILSKTVLERANLNGADLGWADLREATFFRAVAQGAILEKINAEKTDFSEADFSGANFAMAVCREANFEGANLSGAKLVAAHLEEANCTAANFENADLSLAYLDRCYLTYASLRRADLTRTYLEGADLNRADLYRADLLAAHLKSAELKRATLKYASLQNADLFRADLRGANMTGSNLSGAFLLSARLEDADLREANLQDCQIRSPKSAAMVSNRTRFGWIAGEQRGGFGRPLQSQWLVPPLNILSPKERAGIDVVQVSNLYSQIRMLFRDNGFFHRAAAYFQQENYWRTRADLRDKKIGRFLIRWLFFEKFTGYGEKPQRVALTGLALIVLFALLFLFNGLQIEDRLIDYDFLTAAGSPHFLADLWRCLLFSVQCFVTGGLGVLKPAGGLSLTLASIEGLLGMFIIVLSVMVFGRRATRD